MHTPITLAFPQPARQRILRRESYHSAQAWRFLWKTLISFGSGETMLIFELGGTWFSRRPYEKDESDHDVVSGYRRCPAHQRVGSSSPETGGNTLQTGVGRGRGSASPDVRYL